MNNNREIKKLELEIRRLHMVIRLQKDIIDSYRELAELNNGKVVIE